MEMQKGIRLPPLARRKIWELGHRTAIPFVWKVAALSSRYQVSPPTIYKGLERTRKQEFVPRKSINNRFKSLKFVLKRLSKIERNLEEKRNQEARRYNKSYPGEMLHFDTKRLPLLKGESR